VALVDMDFRYGQLATMLDLQADYTITDLCDTPEQLDPAMIDKAMVKHSSGLHLLARPNQFGQADQITAAHCASVLSSLQQIYEYVIVDGPNRYDTGGLTVLDMSDVTLLMAQLLVPSVRNAHRMLSELQDGGYNLNRFRVVCNRVGRDAGHLTVEHLQKTLDITVAHQIPDDWKTVSTAINIGVPLLEYAPKSRVRMAIRELAEKLVTSDGALPAEPTAKGGLFGRIFSGVS
jgi:pilus assembly protein CpaE